jgi:hypothetical protein
LNSSTCISTTEENTRVHKSNLIQKKIAYIDGNETIIEEEEEEELDLLMSQVHDADVSRLVEEKEEEENRRKRKAEEEAKNPEKRQQKAIKRKKQEKEWKNKKKVPTRRVGRTPLIQTQARTRLICVAHPRM